MECGAAYVPGGWTAEVSHAAEARQNASAAAEQAGKAASLFTVTGTLPQLSEEAREAVLAQLRKRPCTRCFAAALPGGACGLLPSAGCCGLHLRPRRLRCSCGARHRCAAAEPLLQLAHAGLPREACWIMGRGTGP